MMVVRSAINSRYTGFMLNGLSRDYWPEETRRVALRTILAFLVAPILAAGITVLAMIVLEVALSRNFDILSTRSLQVAPWVLVGSFILGLSAGVIAFLGLWTLRMRGRMVFALTGLILGAGFAVCVSFFGARPLGVVPVVVMAIHLAIFMLILRAIVGIRRIDG